MLIEKGIHPTRIADGFELAAHFCIKYLESISEEITIEKNKEFLQKIAETALCSKMCLSLLFYIVLNSYKFSYLDTNVLVIIGLSF